jgi:hypothetical protein
MPPLKGSIYVDIDEVFLSEWKSSIGLFWTEDFIRLISEIN